MVFLLFHYNLEDFIHQKHQAQATHRHLSPFVTTHRHLWVQMHHTHTHTKYTLSLCVFRPDLSVSLD